MESIAHVLSKSTLGLPVECHLKAPPVLLTIPSSVDLSHFAPEKWITKQSPGDLDSVSLHSFQRRARLEQTLRQCLPLYTTQGHGREVVSLSPYVSGLKHFRQKTMVD